jgi:hypothetical protein
MSKILDRLVRQLQAKGMPKDKAFAVATKSLQKAGNIKKGSTEPTAKGKKRGNMTPGQRAKDRASKRSGRPPSDFKYDVATNRATLTAAAKKRKKRNKRA